MVYITMSRLRQYFIYHKKTIFCAHFLSTYYCCFLTYHTIPSLYFRQRGPYRRYNN